MARTRKTADPLTPSEEAAEESRQARGQQLEDMKRACAEVYVAEHEVDEKPLTKIQWPVNPVTGKRVHRQQIGLWRGGDVRFQAFCDEVRDQVGRSVSGPFTTHRSQVNKLRDLMELAEAKGDYRTSRALLTDIARLSALDQESIHDPLARFGGVDPRDALRGELVGVLEGAMGIDGEGEEDGAGEEDHPEDAGRSGGTDG